MILLVLVLALFVLVLSFIGYDYACYMALKDSAKMLVENGFDLCWGSHRLYYSKQAGKYLLLRFDKNSNLEHDAEQSFDDVVEAVEQFFSKVKL